MNIPTKSELVGDPSYMLDEKKIIEHFLGKSDDQILGALQELSGYLTEDYMWMAETGLNYYLEAVIKYLENKASQGNWEFVSGILCSLSFQVEENILKNSTLFKIEKITKYIEKNKNKFDISLEDGHIDNYIKTIKNLTNQSARTA